MKKRVKSISISVILFFVLVVVIYIGYVGFIGGPKRAYEREDRLMVEAVMTKQGYTEGRLMNRFSLDTVYYIIDTSDKDGNHIIAWSDKSLEKSGKHDFVEKSAVLSSAKTLGFNEAQINYGVYKDKLVYVFKNGVHEVFMDIDTHEVVYNFKGVL